MKSIKFTLDETQFAGAICSLKASIKGRKVTTIHCSLTKRRLKLDCGDWGMAIIPAKSDSVSKFKISNQSLTRMTACYRKYKAGRGQAPAELNKERGFLKTPETWIPLS